MATHHLPLIALLCILIASYATPNCYAEITSVACINNFYRSSCNFGSTMTISGRNFAIYDKEFRIDDKNGIYLALDKSTNDVLSGTIMSIYYDDDVPWGPYEIEIPTNDSSDRVSSVIVNIGEFYGQDLIPTFFSGMLQNTSYVDGQSANQIWTHMEFNITGKFEPTSWYRVLFYSTSSVYKDIIPTCIRMKVTENVLTCTLGDVDANNLKYSFLVQQMPDRYFLTMNNKLKLITPVEAPTTTTTTTQKPIPTPSDYPIVVNASGNCVSDSSACKDGEMMIFTGEQFADGLTSNYFVDIEGIDKAQCIVRFVTTETLACELTGISDKKGVYLMTIQQKTTNGNWSLHKTFAGSLILGKEDGSGGWTISYLEPTNSGVCNSVNSTSATVTKVLTIIFAILVAILIIVMLVMCIRYKLVDRKTWTKIKIELYNPRMLEMNADIPDKAKNPPIEISR